MSSPSNRLFVAAWPPDDVVDQLRELPRKDEHPRRGRGARFIPPENWHVTLRFLGAADVAAVSDALDRVALPRCTAQLGPGVDVLGPQHVIVPVHGVDELAATVVDATRDLGDSAPRSSFRGHITLARVRRHAALPPVVGHPIMATFDVTDVHLVESRLDPDGARYERLASWPTR